MSELSSLQFKFLKVPITDVSEGLAEGTLHLILIMTKTIYFLDFGTEYSVIVHGRGQKTF